MSYTELTLHAMRHKLFEEALAEYRTETGNPSAPRSGVDLILIEHRLQTLIMAGIGEPSNLERKTSPEMAKLGADAMRVEPESLVGLDYETAKVYSSILKRLGGSAVSQA